MIVGDSYVVVSLFASAVLVGLFLWHLAYAQHAYRRFHDDRAAGMLLAAISKVVVAIGLLISALAVPLDDLVLTPIGLSIARGALLVTVVVLLIGDHINHRGR